MRFNLLNKNKFNLVSILIVSLNFLIINQSISVKAQSFLLADSNHENQHDSHSMSMDKNEDHDHHKTLKISANSPIPKIEIIAEKDPVKGWNLHLITTNFKFAPELISQESSPNQGHAHLYINGEKITRIYSNWYYILDLPKGNNEIKITLNTNQHENLVYEGKIIGNTIFINNP